MCHQTKQTDAGQVRLPQTRCFTVTEKRSRLSDVRVGSWQLIREKPSSSLRSFLLIYLRKQPLEAQQQYMEDMISCLFRTKLRQACARRRALPPARLGFLGARAARQTAEKKTTERNEGTDESLSGQ